VNSVLGKDYTRPRPFLLRFLSRLLPPTCRIEYDQAEQLNVLAGQTVPAVLGGLDVKTMQKAVPGGED
jgi:hypothetical protein